MSARSGIPASRIALMAAAVMAGHTAAIEEAMQKTKEDEAERADRMAVRDERRVIVNAPAPSRTKTYTPNGAREQERRRRQREKREARESFP